VKSSWFSGLPFFLFLLVLNFSGRGYGGLRERTSNSDVSMSIVYSVKMESNRSQDAKTSIKAKSVYPNTNLVVPRTNIARLSASISTVPIHQRLQVRYI